MSYEYDCQKYNTSLNSSLYLKSCQTLFNKIVDFDKTEERMNGQKS